ncbi:hypothetical protein CPHO_10015 [Corynebacterium phocae]|uniref:Uncharacterized protein n=1 Tax=Corynebacterium phocae TaxID=161895 RepID=A0A1L7D4U8_9CORY|nr:hypothetical protein CPHO_10015 [Corynebacterium phocae]
MNTFAKHQKNGNQTTNHAEAEQPLNATLIRASYSLSNLGHRVLLTQFVILLKIEQTLVASVGLVELGRHRWCSLFDYSQKDS